MGELSLRPPRAGDVETLVAAMRPADRAEVKAAGGDVLATVQRSMAASSYATAAVGEDGALAALFGLVPASLTSEAAAPWMLGTPVLDVSRRSLITIARRYISEASHLYPVLENHVDARNTASIRLLRWLGFTIHEAAPYGLAGLPFHRFDLRRP